jgi:MazG family protein
MSEAGKALDRLVETMRALLGPNGCPWDKEQTPESIRAHLLEETYEALAAIDAKDVEGLKEELGDVLYQVVFLSELLSHDGRFDAAEVIHGIADKLVRRHPWVFGDAKVADAADAVHNWEKLKRADRAGKPKDSVLDGIPEALPALLKAHRLSTKAARVGFDWPDVASVLAKVDEEVREFAEAARAGNADRVESELGDLLFALANVARKLNVDPESALRRTNDKFVKRFREVERALRAEGKTPEGAGLEEMERLWVLAKKAYP